MCTGLFLHGRVLGHGAMGHRIDPSWWTHSSISHSSQCSTPGMWYLVCGMVHINNPLLLTGSSSKLVAAAGFLTRYLSGPLPYVRIHITINKMC